MPLETGPRGAREMIPGAGAIPVPAPLGHARAMCPNWPQFYSGNDQRNSFEFVHHKNPT